MSDTTGEQSGQRIDRVLAFAALGSVVVTVACFAATIIATIAGATFDAPIWTVVFATQMIGPIVAVALLIALVLLGVIRRRRAARDS